MVGQQTLAKVMETIGALTGAGLVLAGVLLLVGALDSRHLVLQVLGAVTLAALGAVILLARRLRRLRLVLGGVTLLLWIISMLVALLLPNLHSLALSRRWQIFDSLYNAARATCLG